jgi:60 kDa SS-A/Ro ribonucleoprotein
MSRFAKTSPGTKTVNLAGGEAYTLSPKTELVSMVLTSFVQNDFYRSQHNQVERLKQLVAKDPIFAAKTAIYARTQFGMRTISHIIAGELSRVSGEQWTSRFYNKVVYRVDDIIEILAYYLSIANKNKNGKSKIAKALQRGLAQAFAKFDAYQLAKYRGEGKRPSLIDAVNILKPKPTEKNAEALRKLVKGELRSEGTIEQVLSQVGQQEEKEQATKEALSELVTSRKIGYFALLRNLRNILEKSPEVLDSAISMLTDERLIKKSLILPFQYFTAYKEISSIGGKNSGKLLMAINKAVDISCNNFPEMSGSTCIFLDVSSSMKYNKISEYSDAHLTDVAAIFTAVLAKKFNADIVQFAGGATEVNFDPNTPIMAFAESIQFSGGDTNFIAPFELITERRRKYDRIIILSDMQGWVGGRSPVYQFYQYRQTLGVNPKVISWDLKGYGTAQFPENNILLLAGWSEKLLTLLPKLEQDENALIKEIEAVEL